MVGRTGFEPVKAEPADLQSAAFDRFATYPHCHDLDHIIFLTQKVNFLLCSMFDLK